MTHTMRHAGTPALRNDKLYEITVSCTITLSYPVTLTCCYGELYTMKMEFDVKIYTQAELL